MACIAPSPNGDCTVQSSNDSPTSTFARHRGIYLFCISASMAWMLISCVANAVTAGASLAVAHPPAVDAAMA